MRNINMIKKDLSELSKNFNPEKSTYKVFNELIKHDYTPEEMIKVLSKIRGVHKYPDNIKAKFLDIINSLNILKEQDDRLKQKQKEEEERLKQEAKTRELKDIINNLEKGKAKKAEVKPKVTPEPMPKVEPVPAVEEKKEPEPEVLETPKDKIKEEVILKEEDMEIPEDDGRLLFIILILLVIISIVVIGLFILLY